MKNIIKENNDKGIDNIMSLTKNLLLLIILAGLTVGFVVLSQSSDPETKPIVKTYSYEKFNN